jgi:hypothetical protein
VCDACHIVAVHQEEAPLVRRAAPSFFDIAKQPGTTARSLRVLLAHPHHCGRMPCPKLTPAQIADVSVYILTLCGPPPGR